MAQCVVAKGHNNLKVADRLFADRGWHSVLWSKGTTISKTLGVVMWLKVNQSCYRVLPRTFFLVTSSTKNGCQISEVLISTEEMFSEVGSESRIHPSPARAFSEGWVLGIHRLDVLVCVCVCVCVRVQTMYCENFHTSACRHPRTFRFRGHICENIANFNTTRTNWSQEAPGKVWEKSSENMFSTPFV